jgi:hypothetical protein
MRHLCTAASVVLLTRRAASAQVDLTGSWQAVFHEDQPERIPALRLATTLASRSTTSARRSPETWDASRLTVPEHQCRAHSSLDILRGPANVVLGRRDPPDAERRRVARGHQQFPAAARYLMDGRPHPSPNAEHTWMGFSDRRLARRRSS